MVSRFLIILWLFSFIPQIFCFNALLISVGYAGHVIPLFELAKILKNHHNVTFVTQQLAQSYVDFKSYPNSSSFRVIYSNDSVDAFLMEKKKEQQLIAYSANHSFFDGLAYTSEILGEDLAGSILSKAIHLLMLDHFDVIIANSVIIGTNVLCKQANASCIIQSTESLPNMFDFNLPNLYSSLSRQQMTKIKYRVYNVIFTLRLAVTFIIKLLPSAFAMTKSLPRIPGPFYDSFSMSNLLSTESKCLELFSIPPTLYTPSYSYHYKKYLGVFFDETSKNYTENELTKWIQSKANNSIIYGAFGTSSLVQFNRMQNLLVGVAGFLLKTDDSYLFLVFRDDNYNTYQTVLREMKNNEYLRILNDKHRVQIENRFVQQKWILQQNSIKLFLSHCGMGSCSEGIYFQKPILCMPFNMDQFVNAMSIDHSGIGLSLFVPPSLLQSFLNPHHFHDYTFSSSSVTEKLSTIWENDVYQKTIKIMSLEMKHAGGLKRAVEEIEFFVNLNGNLDRYAPFQSTLPFYQRYMLDLLMIFIVLPVIIVGYVLIKWRKRQRKEKND